MHRPTCHKMAFLIACFALGFYLGQARARARAFTAPAPKRAPRALEALATV